MNYVGIYHHRQYSPMTMMDQEGQVLRKVHRRVYAFLRPNRLIGEATLPKEKRRTFTNVRAFDIMETPF